MGGDRSEREERPRAGGERGTERRVGGGRCRGDDAAFIRVDAEAREFREGGDEVKGG